MKNKIYVIAEDHWNNSAIAKQEQRIQMYGVQHLYHELCNAEPDMLPGNLIKLSKSRITTMLDKEKDIWVGDDKLIDPRFNIGVFELVKASPTIKYLYGFDLRFDDPKYKQHPDIHPQQLRERRMLDILKNSVIPKQDDGEVCCIVCGKDHLRQANAKEMGGTSVLREFIDLNKHMFKLI